MVATSSDRIQSLDLIRGIAVMGIFSVNVVGMAMIERAYFYPPDYGFDSLGDRIMWAANFIIVDGKFRSLFSMLFGASTVLVVERAVAAGREGWQAHYPRMFVLLLFGMAHYYLLWWGDILVSYALVGMVAFIFWRLPARLLLLLSGLSLALMWVPSIADGLQQVAEFEAKSAPDASPAERAALREAISPPSAEELAEDRQAHESIATRIEASTDGRAAIRPFASPFRYRFETLGLMLLGMAGYKSGFLTGAWSRRRYVLVAVAFAGASLAYYSTAAWAILRADFDPFVYYPLARVFAILLQPVAAVGYSALVILLLARHGNALTARIAAVGRAAFTNYIGATLFGSFMFYQFGLRLYGEVSRGEAWLFAPVAWAIMLLWSKPWLDRFRYGPFEWAWRSLSRWRWEPMRRVAAA